MVSRGWKLRSSSKSRKTYIKMGKKPYLDNWYIPIIKEKLTITSLSTDLHVVEDYEGDSNIPRKGKPFKIKKEAMGYATSYMRTH